MGDQDDRPAASLVISDARGELAAGRTRQAVRRAGDEMVIDADGRISVPQMAVVRRAAMRGG